MLNKYINFRYKPSQANFVRCGVGVPKVFDDFDWIFWEPDARSVERRSRFFPRTVLCLPSVASISRLLKLKWRLSDATIFFAGGDANLSEFLPQISNLLPRVKQVYFEAKDINHPSVKSFSMGFISYYIANAGIALVSQLQENVVETSWRKDGVLASWGGIWKYLDDQLEDRKALGRFVGHSPWLERESLAPCDYWKRLAESKFLLAPAGAGIQAPKLAEAWLVRTVPIVTRNPCFEDLENEGFPLLILEKWEDLTPERLEDYEEERSRIDWTKIDTMLTLEYFNKRYLSK